MFDETTANDTELPATAEALGGAIVAGCRHRLLGCREASLRAMRDGFTEHVDLRITNLTEYYAWRTVWNGVKREPNGGFLESFSPQAGCVGGSEPLSRGVRHRLESVAGIATAELVQVRHCFAHGQLKLQDWTSSAAWQE